MTGRERKEYIRRARIAHLRDQEDARKATEDERGWHRLYLCCSVFWAGWSGAILLLLWDMAPAVTLVVVAVMWSAALVIKSDFGRWPWEAFRRRGRL